MSQSNETLVNDFLLWLAPKSAERTMDQYQRDLTKFLDYIGTKSLIDPMLGIDMERFMYRDRRNGLLPAGATSRRELMEFRRLDYWLSEVVQVIPKSRASRIESPHVNNVRPKPVSDDDWKKLWFADLPDGLRIAIGFGYFYGWRRSEILSLAPNQVQALPTPTVKGLRRKGGKTSPDIRLDSHLRLFSQRRPDLIGSPDMFYKPLWTLHARRLTAVRLLPWEDEKDRTKVTATGIEIRPGQKTLHKRPPGVIHPKMFNSKLAKWCHKVGTEVLVTPHMLRHSFCTNLIRMDLNYAVVNKLAAHKNMSTTMVYVGLGDDPLSRYLDDEDHAEQQTYESWG